MKYKGMLLGLSLLLGSSGVFAAVDINTADADTLVKTLKGVGPSKAAAIIEYRELNGPFGSVDELVNVKGIGQKLLEENRQEMMVGTKK